MNGQCSCRYGARFAQSLFFLWSIGIGSLLAGCDRPGSGDNDGAIDAQAEICDPDDGSLLLPEGFCARVVADNLGFVRHIAVDGEGDLYAALRNLRFDLGGILALRDSDGDGRLEEIVELDNDPGFEIEIHQGWLYFGADDAIYRYRLRGGLEPESPPQVIVEGFPEQEEHTGKTFAFDDGDHVYVNIGAPSNACQKENREPGVYGLDPCPELERHAGIWQFEADRAGQKHVDGRRYASGIRNAYAIAWSRVADKLFIVQHGRDQLYEFWPQFYTVEDGANLPSEEMIRVESGGVFGWPYCYHDPELDRLVLAPEYGGDGRISGRCVDYPDPVLAFPAHYSPHDMLFYEADQFPPEYRDGAFIAFHGSYNRGDLQQLGYQVVFVPFEGGQPTGEWQVFADGFAGDGGPVESPDDAEFRPTGLALGPDGSLYVSDSVQGRIWRIRYVGPPSRESDAG